MPVIKPMPWICNHVWFMTISPEFAVCACSFQLILNLVSLYVNRKVTLQIATPFGQHDTWMWFAACDWAERCLPLTFWVHGLSFSEMSINWKSWWLMYEIEYQSLWNINSLGSATRHHPVLGQSRSIRFFKFFWMRCVKLLTYSYSYVLFFFILIWDLTMLNWNG